MLVKMLKTELGSPDGIQCVEYREGEEYDLNESLTRTFVGSGSAEHVTPEPEPESKPEMPKKSRKGAPENKAK